MLRRKGIGRGWWFESERHRLARMGIKTGRKRGKAKVDKWTTRSPSLLKSQLKEYLKLGSELIDKGLITGFNIRDINEKGLKGHKQVIYAHGSSKHLNKILKMLRDKEGIKLIAEFPRISGYKWDSDWQTSTIKTKIYRVDDMSQAKLTKDGYVKDKNKEYLAVDIGEAYIVIVTQRPKDIIKFFKERAIHNKSKKVIEGSWEVPDIRAKNLKKLKDFRKAYMIRKKIDGDTEFVTLVPKSKIKEVKESIKGKEKVEPILIQNIQGHSLYEFIQGKG